MLGLLFTGLATALLLLVPGASIVYLLRWGRLLNPYCLLPAALLGTLALNTVVFTPLLVAGVPMAQMRWVWLGATGLLVVAATIRAVRHAGSFAAAWQRAGTASFAWLRSIGPWTAALAAVAGLIGFVWGTRLFGDSLYHLGQALKILELPSPNLENLSRFADGSANPAYFIPTVHATYALIASLAGVGINTVFEVVPGITLALSILAYGGLGETLLRTRAAAPLAGAVYIVWAIIGTAPYVLPAVEGLFPGNITLDILLPFATATAYLAVYGAGADARSRLGLLVALSALVVVLHANYMLYFGIAAGILVTGGALTLGRAFPVRRALVMLGATVGTGAVGLVLLLPILARLTHFGRGSDPDTNAEVLRRFDQLYVGDASSFHLIPGQLYHYGGIAVLGVMLAGLLVLWKPTEPASWLAGGTVLAGVALTQWDWLFMQAMGLGSTSVLLRVDRIMPVPIVMTALLLWSDAFVRSRWGANPAARLLVPTATAASVAVAFWAFPFGRRALAFAKAEESFPEWPLYVGVVLAVAGLITMLIRGNDRKTVEYRLRPIVLLSVFAGAVVPGANLVAELPTRIGERVEKVYHSLPADLNPWTMRQLSKLPAGAVVLTDRRTAYSIPAVVPHYVVGDYKWWLASTAQNAPRERLRDVDRFFKRSSDRKRRKVLCKWKPDAILVTDRASRLAHRYVEAELDGPVTRRGHRIFRRLEWDGDQAGRLRCDGTEPVRAD